MELPITWTGSNNKAAFKNNCSQFSTLTLFLLLLLEFVKVVLRRSRLRSSPNRRKRKNRLYESFSKTKHSFSTTSLQRIVLDIFVWPLRSLISVLSVNARVLHARLQRCQPPLSLWNTEQNGKNTSFNSPSSRTQGEVSKSQSRERSQQTDYQQEVAPLWA